MAPIAVILRKDMKLAEEFLKSLPSDFPRDHLEELRRSHRSLENAFSSLSNASSERMEHIVLAIDREVVGVGTVHTESDWSVEGNLIVYKFNHKLKYFVFRVLSP